MLTYVILSLITCAIFNGVLYLIFRRYNAARIKLEQTEQMRLVQERARLTLHIDYLIRHYHLMNIPYVQNGRNLTDVACLHCGSAINTPHSDHCAWRYVHEHFILTPSGRPKLKA